MALPPAPAQASAADRSQGGESLPGAAAQNGTRRPVRVALDLTVLELSRTGTARATVALADALERVDGVELIQIAQPPPRPLLSSRIARGLGREALWLSGGVSRRARRSAADVLHLPSTLSVPYGRTPLVMTVHDTFPWERPEWCSYALRAQHRTRVSPALHRVASFVVPSRWTAARVVERLGVDPALITVVPHGVGGQFTPGRPDAAVLERLGVRRPYLLGFDSTVRRKNLGGLLDAFGRVVSAGRPHDLILVGGDGTPDRALDGRIARLGGRARRIGWVDDAALVELYRGADALVFPTLGEGFGFPVVEAMACATPVVSNRVGSVPEVTGDAALLVEPGADGALAAAVEAVLDPDVTTRLVGRGLERVRRFTWERAAEATADVYRSTVERAL